MARLSEATILRRVFDRRHRDYMNYVASNGEDFASAEIRRNLADLLDRIHGLEGR